jgi:hypothetical protein
MKVTISTSDLKEALGICQSTLGSSSDITSHFVFIREGSGASVISCSPPRTFSKVPLAGATIQDTSSFSLDGKRILQAINAVNGVLEISHSEEEDEQGDVELKSPNGSLTLGSLDPSSFPPWMDKLGEATLLKEVSSSVLYDTLNTLKGYISQDDSRRPELSMLVVEDGKAFACDGFALSIAKHSEYEGLNLKLHYKDIAPLMKFLKAYDGNTIEILSGGQATFFRAEDGATFGAMDVPHTFPPIMSQYAEAFSWVPRRVWRVSKESLLTGINFLSAGADKADFRVSYNHAEGEFSPPYLEMKPSNGKGSLTYNLTELPVNLAEGEGVDSVVDPGDRMYLSRMETTVDSDDISSFKFNYLNMKRATETMGDAIVFGCNQENNKGYMVFKALSSSGVENVSIIGWMI